MTRIAIKSSLKQLRIWALVVVGLFSSALDARGLSFDTDVWEINSKYDLFGIRNKLADHGIYVMPIYIQDLDWPTTGGIQVPAYPLYFFVFSLELGIEFEKLCNIKGFKSYINFIEHQGRQPSPSFVGDYQGFDNLEAFPLTQLSELWVEQTLFNDRFVIRAGKIDAYTLFQYTPYAQTLLNNSYSQLPTILGYPSYPNPSVGVIAFWDVCSWFALRSSVFDGSNAQGVNTGNFGAKRFFQNLGKHLLLMNEVDFVWCQNRYFGEAILGVWGFNGQLPNFDGTTSGKAAGPYFSISQTLWQQKMKKTPNFKQGTIGCFSQFGYANPNVSGATYCVTGGITYNNLVKTWSSDSLSLGAATVFFSKARGAPFTKTYETSLECTYQVYIKSGILVQPDVQWIIHPGGNQNRNALVVSLRLGVSI